MNLIISYWINLCFQLWRGQCSFSRICFAKNTCLHFVTIITYLTIFGSCWPYFGTFWYDYIWYFMVYKPCNSICPWFAISSRLVDQRNNKKWGGWWSKSYRCRCTWLPRRETTDWGFAEMLYNIQWYNDKICNLLAHIANL